MFGDWPEDWLATVQSYQLQVVASIVIFAILYFGRVLLNRLITNHVTRLRSRYVWRQSVNYVFLGSTIVSLAIIWTPLVQEGLTILTLVAAALTIVSKEFILNILGYFTIVWRGPFVVGDRIQIGQNQGDVVEIGTVYFTLAEIGGWVQGDEPTGRLIRCPNSLVLTQPIQNSSEGLDLIWSEVIFQLPAEADWRRARDTAQRVAGEFSHRFTSGDVETIKASNHELLFTKTEPSVYVAHNDDKIKLTVRYACRPHARRTSEQKIWETFWEQFDRKQERSPSEAPA